MKLFHLKRLELERKFLDGYIEDIRACDNKYIWHPFTQHSNCRDHIYIKSSDGAYLYDNNNRKIFDAISSWWVNLHGHCHPKIADAISEQARILEHGFLPKLFMNQQLS